MEKRKGEAFTSDFFAQYENTIRNGEARIPICFCIDTSSSMGFITNSEEDFEVLNNGQTRSVDGSDNVRRVRLKPGVQQKTHLIDLQKVLKKMIEKMQNDPVIEDAAVLCIITFDKYADCFKEFTDIRRIEPGVADQLRCGADSTNYGKGINMSLNRLDQIRKMNVDAGNDSYLPVLIFMSDGVPTDSDHMEWIDQVRERSEEGKLNVIPICIGDRRNEVLLRRMTSVSRVYHMDTEQEFAEVFEMISQRIYRTANVITVDEGIKAEKETRDERKTSVYGASASISDFSELFSSLSSQQPINIVNNFNYGGNIITNNAQTVTMNIIDAKLPARNLRELFTKYKSNPFAVEVSDLTRITDSMPFMDAAWNTVSEETRDEKMDEFADSVFSAPEFSDRSLSQAQMEKYSIPAGILDDLSDPCRKQIVCAVQIYELLGNLSSHFSSGMDEVAVVRAILFCRAFENILNEWAYAYMHVTEPFASTDIELYSKQVPMKKVKVKNMTIGTYEYLLSAESNLRTLISDCSSRQLDSGGNIGWWENYNSRLDKIRNLRNKCCHSGKQFTDSDLSEIVKYLFEYGTLNDSHLFHLLNSPQG